MLPAEFAAKWREANGKQHAYFFNKNTLNLWCPSLFISLTRDFKVKECRCKAMPTSDLSDRVLYPGAYYKPSAIATKSLRENSK